MKENIRESNFELMRIFSMFFIVLYHFIAPTGGNLINSTSGYTQIFFQLVSIFTIVHVNSFILLTGYFQYNKKFKFKKVFDLLLMAWMYKIVIGLAFYYNSSNTYNSLDFIKIISPLELNNLWFLIVYLELYIISPYINIIINKLNQQEYRKLLIILFIVFSIIPTITNQRLFASNGFDIINFVYIYLIGAYLKKYPVRENIHFKNYSDRKKRCIFIVLFLFLGLFNFLLYSFSINYLVNSNNPIINEIGLLIEKNTFFYQYPTIIIQSIVYFLIFETFKVKSKIINLISSSVFAIYIITENIYMRDWMYIKMNILKYHVAFDYSIIPKVLLYSLLIFIGCTTIEFLRKLLISIICKIYKLIFKTHKKL